MGYNASFQPNQVISSSQLNTNFSILRDNLEIEEDLTLQITGNPSSTVGSTDFTVSNTINPATYPLVEVYRNGIKQRQAGLTPDFVIAGANLIRFVPTTNILNVGETLVVRYREAV